MWFRSGGGSECGWPLPQDVIAQEFGRKELSRALRTQLWMARCRTTSANRRRSGFTLRDVLSGLMGER